MRSLQETVGRGNLWTMIWAVQYVNYTGCDIFWAAKLCIPSLYPLRVDTTRLLSYIVKAEKLGDQASA